MTVGIRVGVIVDEIGTSEFFHAFFSTISKKLEPNGWGSRFPEIMDKVYQGGLEASYANKVATDFQTIKAELEQFKPSEIVWDIDDLNAKPPWGSNISSDITSLGNYFVTSTGRDLFDVLFECLEAVEDSGETLIVERY